MMTPYEELSFFPFSVSSLLSDSSVFNTTSKNFTQTTEKQTPKDDFKRVCLWCRPSLLGFEENEYESVNYHAGLQ